MAIQPDPCRAPHCRALVPKCSCPTGNLSIFQHLPLTFATFLLILNIGNPAFSQLPDPPPRLPDQIDPWTGPAAITSSVFNEMGGVHQHVKKILWGLGITLLMGTSLLVWLKRTTRGSRLPESSLAIATQLHLSSRNKVSLLRIGASRVLVGHDAQGIRSMVLLPEWTTDRMDEEPAYVEPVREELLVTPFDRHQFMEVGDSGWELNRRTS